MSLSELEAFLAAEFPAAAAFATPRAVREGAVDVALASREDQLRPGGTISGPTLMALADTAAYYLVLAACGPLALAVTSSLEIHFLARPRPGTLVATAQLLKQGRRLVVASVDVRADAAPDLLARATVTYALPDG